MFRLGTEKAQSPSSYNDDNEIHNVNQYRDQYVLPSCSSLCIVGKLRQINGKKCLQKWVNCENVPIQNTWKRKSYASHS